MPDAVNLTIEDIPLENFGQFVLNRIKQYGNQVALVSEKHILFLCHCSNVYYHFDIVSSFLYPLFFL